MKVKELYTDPSKWTKNAFARTKDGTPCYSSNPDAFSFCLSGAVGFCYIDNLDEQAEAFTKLKRKIFSVWNWNDHPDRTFDEVKQLVNELDI